MVVLELWKLGETEPIVFLLLVLVHAVGGHLGFCVDSCRLIFRVLIACCAWNISTQHGLSWAKFHTRILQLPSYDGVATIKKLNTKFIFFKISKIKILLAIKCCAIVKINACFIQTNLQTQWRNQDCKHMAVSGNKASCRPDPCLSWCPPIRVWPLRRLRNRSFWKISPRRNGSRYVVCSQAALSRAVCVWT